MYHGYDDETGSYAKCSCDANLCKSEDCPECALESLEEARSAYYHLQDVIYQTQTKLPDDALKELERLAQTLECDFILELNRKGSCTQCIFSDLIKETGADNE